LRITKGNYKKPCECGCGKLIWHYGAQGYPIRFAWGHNVAQANTKRLAMLPRGSSHYNWKGGRQKSGEYMALWAPDHPFASKTRNVREHRYVWEQEHNACVLPWAVVHHKDGNKKNNIWYNLQAMLESTHMSLHNKGTQHRKIDMSDRFCIICSRKTYIDRKGHARWFIHPITKQKWICYSCQRKIYSSL
jgi:HNH endonuclease